MQTLLLGYLFGCLIVTLLIKIFPSHVPQLFVPTTFKIEFFWEDFSYVRAGFGTVVFWPIWLVVSPVYCIIVFIYMLLALLVELFNILLEPKSVVEEPNLSTTELIFARAPEDWFSPDWELADPNNKTRWIDYVPVYVANEWSKLSKLDKQRMARDYHSLLKANEKLAVTIQKALKGGRGYE